MPEFLQEVWILNNSFNLWVIADFHDGASPNSGFYKLSSLSMDCRGPIWHAFDGDFTAHLALALRN